MTAPALGRRRFLMTAAAGAAGLFTACTPNPLVTADPERTPQPAPTLDDARRKAAIKNARLIEVLTGCARQIGGGEVFTTWCGALAAQHRAHLLVLSQPDPLGGVQADHSPLEKITATAPSCPTTPAAAMALIAAEERALADELAGFAAGSDLSLGMALFWVSQLVAARTATNALRPADPAALGPAPVLGSAVPAGLAAGTPTQARQVLLSHQRALVFGLEAILGKLAATDPQVAVITGRLGEAMKQRDETAAAIVASSATPSPVAEQYTLPGDPNDPAKRNELWGRLELAVLDGWGRLAATDASARAQAIDQMVAQASRARRLGVALPYWPGWV